MKYCRKEIESFLSNVEPWLECKRLEKEEQAEKAIKQFSCIARGEDPCL